MKLILNPDLFATSLPVPRTQVDNVRLARLSGSDVGTWLGAVRTGQTSYETHDGVPINITGKGIKILCNLVNDILST